jgi:adenine-specific DNA-methyltransferase
MKAMLPRLQMMKAMLKPSGIIAICIDDNELFHLGMMMDEVFGESNRLAIINWQKTTPKNDAKHVSIITEYVLVYAKDIDYAKTRALERSEKSNVRFFNPDNDSLGEWKQDNLTAASGQVNSSYAIQSPFTGEFHNSGNRFWSHKKSTMKQWLEGWGSQYEECDIGDKRSKALALKGWSKSSPAQQEMVIADARKRAEKILEEGNWPILYWGLDGLQKPVRKTHLLTVRSGAVPVSFWVEEDESPIQLDSVSWVASQSGRSRDGVEELNAVFGKDHGFETVKPLRLFRKIIQIWCPHNGLVLDPYAGSGTTGHAVLELNAETDATRRFILIEQGAPEKGDKYARSLMQERLRRAITGERLDENGNLAVIAEPLGGGLQFRMLTKKIDSKTVLTMQKDELIDVVITSHWENAKRSGCSLIRIEEAGYKYLVGKNEQKEGYFLIWNGGDHVGRLDAETYTTVIQEGKKAGLKQPYHVYARYEIYQSKNIIFYKIPDKILAHLGLNENSDRFNEGAEE